MVPARPQHQGEAALIEELAVCETSVWQALVRGDRDADIAALDEGFLGVYADGFAGRDDHAGQLVCGPTIAGFELSALRAMSLGPDHALLSYRANFRKAGSDVLEAMYVSSVWRRRVDGGWTNVFSQDTPASD